MGSLIKKLKLDSKKVLSQKEMRELISIAQAGKGKKAITARNKMVEHNVGLISKYAKVCQFTPECVSYDDLFQEGVLGLMKAIEKFDLKRNVRFSTYALWWIRQAITRYIDNHSRMVRIPVHLCEKMRRIKNKHENQQKLTKKEIKLLAIFSDNGSFSIDTKLWHKETDTYTYHDKLTINIKESEELVKHDLYELVRLTKSKKRDEKIYKYRATGETLQSVGKKFKMCHERVRQIEEQIRNDINEIVEGEG